jgi:GNAT superfamily N-acetyltransferase
MALTKPIIGAPLSASELPAAEALVRETGWNQIAADWEIFRALGTVHAARAGGHVVATAATLPYGEFAFISMVLVAGTHRRHGLGTMLLKHCMAELDKAGQVPVLDATPAGRPIYRTLGFEDSWGYHRLTRPDTQAGGGSPAPADGTIIRSVDEADWPHLYAYDAKAFGADRRALLQRLRGRLPAAELIAERHGRIEGFMLGRDGRSASHIGPLVAEDDGAALALLARALASINGPIYLDFADSKTAIGAWLTRYGFSAQRPLTRMLYRRKTGFDDTARTFAVVGPEFG